MTFAIANVIIYAVAKKRGDKMSPRTGRPPKLGKSKNISLQLRITEKTSQKLKECSEQLKISRTEVIEKGIDLMHERL